MSSNSEYVVMTSTEPSLDTATDKVDAVVSQFSEEEIAEIGIRQVNSQWQVWFKIKLEAVPHGLG